MTPFEAVQIIEWDDDDSIDMQDVVDAIQCLIDTGTIYHLQGSYQRLAQDMLDEGLVHMPDVYHPNSPVQYLL
jgi:hypothetical protein|tara:strand:- start:647 stop:865 length:219 start_codon:yes stop_codon:yes gene_type:complete